MVAKPAKPQVAPDIIEGGEAPQRFNPLSEKSIKRLRSSVKKGRDKLERARKERLKIIEEYVGSHYGEGGASKKTPVNLIAMSVIIDLQWLASRAPSVSVTTPHEEYRAFSNSLELGMRHLLKEIRFGKHMRSVVLDALFGMGIFKVGKADSGILAFDDVNYRLQRPFADRVDFDDWVHDPRARSLEHADFMGNIWQMPYDVLMESGEFENVDGIKPNDGEYWRESERKAREISKSKAGAQEQDFRPYVDLIDIYLPFERLVVTMPYRGEGKPIRTVQYDGPPNGPYHVLAFHEVPDNILALAPLGLVKDLADLANRLFRKAGRQAERQKTVTAYTPAASSDMDRIVNANDGDTIQVSHLDQIREISYGAANPMTQAMFMQSKDLFSWFAGNLDALGGLGPQSETAKQDQLLAESASARMKSMQDAVYEFTHEVLQDLAWNLCDIPLMYVPIIKQVQGVSEPIYVPTELNLTEKLGEFMDYNFDIEPHSMQPQSPEQKVQALMQILGLYAPFMPVMQQQGVAWNMEKLIRHTAKLANLPELENSVVFAQPQEQPGPLSEPQAGAKPATTTRKYVRINRPGGTRQGQSAAMMQTLLGNAVQPAEAAGMNQSLG